MIAFPLRPTLASFTFENIIRIIKYNFIMGTRETLDYLNDVKVVQCFVAKMIKIGSY